MINWLKRNWALAILLLIGLFWVKNQFLGYSSVIPMTGGGMVEDSAPSFSTSKTVNLYPGRQAAPTDTANRLVITDTSLSLQVNDVAAVIADIENQAKGFGGYMVNSNLSRPESAASGTISLRVPEDKRAAAMTAFKKLAVKVVSESVYGNDVTDSYVDIDSRLNILTDTKAKYQDILARATSVNDILTVTDRLTELQNQIDNLKGQQNYLSQSAKLTKITVYLSTDDLALPYAPTNVWRPAVIFKEAVRSLIGTFRDLGSLIIWAVVYLPILIPVGLVIWYLKRRSAVKH